MRYRILSLLCCGLVFLAGCNAFGASPTPAPSSPQTAAVMLINSLQAYLNAMDPVGVVLDARFQIVDVTYDANAEKKEIGLNISITCEGLCSRERSFSTLMRALVSIKDKVPGLVPATLKTFTVITYEEMGATGEVTAKWQDILDYLNGALTGAQLANRVARP